MDFSRLTYLLINDVNFESRSALPDAPVVPAPAGRTGGTRGAGRARGTRGAGRTRRRLAALNGRLASALHRAAWAIEPPPSLTGNRRGPRPCEGACS